MIAVIALSPDDWRRWRELRLAALAEAPASFGSRLADWTGARDAEHRWRARLTSVPFNAIVTCDGEPAGMVGAVTTDDGTVELISLWVSPNFRGRGVGDAAVRAVVHWAGVNYPGCAVVLSVKAANARAIALYARHGFRISGPSPDGPNELSMRREADHHPHPHAGKVTAGSEPDCSATSDARHDQGHQLFRP